MGESVTFPSNGETAEGYLALPPTGRGPALVVLQEWWGLVPHIVDVTERFAAEGFVALAPDLYRGETTTEPDEAGKRMMALDLDRAARDIAGAAAYLKGRPEATGGVGVVGFCMGGGLALWSGTVSPDVVATVPFYPALPWEGLSPDWSAYAGKAVLVHAAEGDGGTGNPQLRAAADALREAGADVTLHDYPGTQHAFYNDTRPEVHDPDASRLAWGRTVEFLRARIG